VDAPHRPEIFAEVEYDGELVAEVFEAGEGLSIALVDHAGKPLWEAPLSDVETALAGARAEMNRFAKRRP
jgi:hypothetical protein